MKNAPSLSVVLLVISFTVLACGSAAPTEVAPLVEATPSRVSTIQPATSTITSTAVPVSSPTPTTEPLQLEIVQSQIWTDRDENVRVNVLMRNPYDFPVAPAFRGQAKLKTNAGELARFQELYFLDGISGGNGFLLPGETIAANACFTCEQAPLTKAWDLLEFEAVIQEASENWEYVTDVEVNVGSVTFDGDSPIFWINGTVKNNTDAMLSRISARVFVFDQEGNLVGAAEASGWDVGAGSTASFNGYGIGQAPDGPIKFESTALGVIY